MVQVVAAPFDASTCERALAFDADIMGTHGFHAFNEAVRRGLTQAGTPDAYLCFADDTVGYLWRIDTAAPHWELTIASPGPTADPVITAVADRALELATMHGGGALVAWVPGAEGGAEPALIELGFTPDRVLLQLRVALPVDATPAWPTGITVRAFHPGADDDAFLAVNNAAFAGHPEQGAWDQHTLRARLEQRWFDPAGFLLAFDGNDLVGFVWMKLHTLESVPQAIGEIYAIGVAPDAQGRGLGRALALAGLEWAAASVPEGMLYVDASNHGAVRMYESIGFHEHHRNRAYRTNVDAR